MARTRFTISNEAEVTTGTSAKTMLQLVTPANIGVAVRGFSIDFDGTSGTAEPGLVELVVQTSAGTMSAATPQHDDRRATGLTIQSSAQKTATAEPTDGGVVLRRYHVHPQTGVEFKWWLDEELIMAGSSATRLGVRVTFAAAVNAYVQMFCEE